MSTFEEQFPGLYNASLREYGCVLLEFRDNLIYDNCLDKQKVREAIKKILETYGTEDYDVIEFKEELLKELGL